MPRIKTAIEKHWNLLQINEELQQSFEQKPKLVYRRNKNLRDYIGQTTIRNNKVLKKRDLKEGKCRPCLTNTRNLCCRQMSSNQLKLNKNSKFSTTQHAEAKTSSTSWNVENAKRSMLAKVKPRSKYG